MKRSRIISALTAFILSICLMGCSGTMQASAPELESGQDGENELSAPGEGEPEDGYGQDMSHKEGEESLFSGQAREGGEENPIRERRIFSSRQIMDACIYHCLSGMDQWYQLRARMTDGVEEDDLYGDEDGEVEVQLLSIPPPGREPTFSETK